MSETKKATPEGAQEGGELTSSDYYFNSYSHYGIHEEMLKDEVRTGSYMKAIVENGHLFKDKVVLDVGCGTSILCLFAAKAGAKHVYGIDCSDIIEQSRKIVELNGYADRITLIKGKVEEIDLPVDKVDIIISEWMGYFLLYESMLDTVLWARDKWLTKEGLLFPDHATLWVAGIEDGDYKAEKLGYWDNVYGFNFSPIRDIAKIEPLVDVVNEQAIMSTAHCILDLDLKTCTKEDLTFESDWAIKATRDDFCHALVAYFDIDFKAAHRTVSFSTGPAAKYTHWKQTVFYMEESLVACRGEEIKGKITCAPNGKNPRDLDITMDYEFKGKHGDAKNSIAFKMH